MSKKNIIFSYLVLFLFFFGHFVMPNSNEDFYASFNLNRLPNSIIDFSSFIRWLLIGLISVISLQLISINKVVLKVPEIMLSIFYFIQFCYALIDGNDYVRFLIMTISSLLIPGFISYSLKNDEKIFNKLFVIIVILLFFSIFFNVNLVLSGQRFMGFMNNSNLYGITAIFWFVVLKIVDKKVEKKYINFLSIIIAITIILSGSRNAVIGLVLILLISNYKSIFKFIFTDFKYAFVFLVFFFALNKYIDLSLINDRLFAVVNSYKDSGREDIWRRAYFAIEQNLLWGNGMDANLIIADTGNMHNCFLRMILNMGLIFTILSFIFYFISLLYVFRNMRIIPNILFGFLVSFTLMNLGEDFFVGLGSTVFIFILFIYGFINYFLRNEYDTR